MYLNEKLRLLHPPDEKTVFYVDLRHSKGGFSMHHAVGIAIPFGIDSLCHAQKHLLETIVTTKSGSPAADLKHGGRNRNRNQSLGPPLVIIAL